MAYGKVSETYWHDRKIRSLSSNARFFMLYLLTSPHRNRIGCFVLDPHYAAADMMWPVEDVEACMHELEAADRIEWDEEARVVFVPKYFAHNTLENSNVAKGAKSDLAAVPDTQLLRKLLDVVTHPDVYKKHFEPLVERLKERVADLPPQPYPEPPDNGSRNSMDNGSGNGSGNGSEPVAAQEEANGSPNGLGNQPVQETGDPVPVAVPISVSVSVGKEHTHSRPPVTRSERLSAPSTGDGRLDEVGKRGKHPDTDRLWDGVMRARVLDVWHCGREAVELGDKSVKIGLEALLFSDLLWRCNDATDDPELASDMAAWLVRESRRACGWDDGEPRTLYWLLREQNFEAAQAAYLAQIPAGPRPADLGVRVKTIPHEARTA